MNDYWGKSRLVATIQNLAVAMLRIKMHTLWTPYNVRYNIVVFVNCET
jgi:hypothetical protein